MIKKSISVNTTDAKIYRQILSFMNFILEATPQERQVLAEIIRLNNDYELLPADRRGKFILSTEMRKEMREITEIEEKQFNGIISKLRKKTLFGKPFLGENNILHPELIFKGDAEGFKIELCLNLNEKKVEEVKEEPKVEKVESEQSNITSISNTKVKEKEKLAAPSNGIEGVVANEFDSSDIVLVGNG